MSVGETLISKVLDANDLAVFTRFEIERDHFPTEIERRAYDFVCRYGNENRGQAPSYATVVGEIPDFVYTPAVTDSYEYLARKLKSGAGKRSIAKILNEEVAQKFAELDTGPFADWLTERLYRVKMGTSVRKRVGSDFAKSANTFLDEYRARKEGRSFKIWRSKFPSVNAAIGGGYYSGNMYTWYARSGRGKSVVTMEEALESAFQGATVLVWALEMALYEWMARALSSISARSGVVKAMIEGAEYETGFDNRALLSGQLSEDFEKGLETYLAELNDRIPGRIILRAVDDEDFRERSVKQLESDIRETGADVVVIDPIYYMDYEANTSRVAGGDVAATSKSLRRIAGATKTVIHVITQAEENESEKNEEGVRELKPPKRAEIKKTKAVLEDAANVFGIDTLAHEGRGIIEIGKGRSGGEDTRIELLYLPNYGIVREMSGESDRGRQFAGNF